MIYGIEIGNTTFVKRLTYSKVYGSEPSFYQLTNSLHSFSLPDVLVTLARMNMFLSKDEEDIAQVCQKQFILKRNFLSLLLDPLLELKSLNSRIIFSRHAILRLLHIGCLVSPPNSERSLNRNDAMYDLGNCFLMMNDFLGIKNGRNLKEDLLTQLIPICEYSKFPDTKETMVRFRELLNLIQQDSSQLNVNDTFLEATGLSVEEYQCLIFGILAIYLELTLEQILRGGGEEFPIDVEQLVRRTRNPEHIGDLYRKLLKHDCICIDDLPNEIYRSLADTPLDEFHVFRKYPLVEMKDHRITCIDPTFLGNKLETGIFWIVFNQLQKSGSDPTLLISLWGRAFGKYVSSILERALSNSTQVCISSPKYEVTNQECTDIIIQSDDTLALLECKSSLLTADAKYNRKFHDLQRDLKLKFVGTKNEPKGIWQLWNAIQSLVSNDENKKRKIEGIDISGIKRVYPVLVVLEDVLSTPFMNWYLDQEFRDIIKPSSLLSDIEIMPLAVLTISDLEYLEPYLSNRTFHDHLDKWIEQYKKSDFVGFSIYLNSLKQKDLQRNQFMEQRFHQISKDIEEFFF